MIWCERRLKMKTVQVMLAEAEAQVPRISPEEAKRLLGRTDVLFLDVREPASPLHDKAFDQAKTVVAYCASGGRSALVGKTLKEMGYANVKNLGGFKGWLDAGGEVEKA